MRIASQGSGGTQASQDPSLHWSSQSTHLQPSTFNHPRSSIPVLLFCAVGGAAWRPWGVRRPCPCVRHRSHQREELHAHGTPERKEHERKHSPKLWNAYAQRVNSHPIPATPATDHITLSPRLWSWFECVPNAPTGHVTRLLYSCLCRYLIRS